MGASWPVTGPDNLTLEHIPQALQDRIAKPYKDQAAEFARALAEINDARLATLQGLDLILRQALKEDGRFKSIFTPLFMAKLQAAALGAKEVVQVDIPTRA